MAHDIEVLTDALVRLQAPGASSPAENGTRPGTHAAPAAQSTRQRRLWIRDQLEALTPDLDQLWNESLESGDFDLVTSAVEAAHAVHGAILALGNGRIDGVRRTRRTSHLRTTS